jgi:hypothetical protein
MCRVTAQEREITEIRNSRGGAKGVLISVMPRSIGIGQHKAQPNKFKKKKTLLGIL